MRQMLIALLALEGLVAAAGVGASPATEPSHRFEGKDLFQLQYVTDPQIRPDGRQIAYVRISFDVMSDRERRSIWLFDLQSGSQTPLAAGMGSSYSPRWSPDGKRLAYVSTAEGGHAQLFVRWLQGAQAARITDLTEAPSDLQWSPDGHSIAFTMLTPDERPGLGSAPPKPEGANWAEGLTVITNIRYRADGEGYLKPGFSHVFVV
ncbi:MAG: PD40 domain-containing protein, partial [Sinobacteraceae bacterium]|nr:PD40 domain-containing protein [Nevskiaceae bacterium]